MTGHRGKAEDAHCQRVVYAQTTLMNEASLVAEEAGPRATVAALMICALRLARKHDAPICGVNLMWSQMVASVLDDMERDSP